MHVLQNLFPLPLSGSLNADLHCHSTVSDGTQTPEWLAERAHANGVQLWALTDHDEISGVARAQAAAQRLGMAFLSGVEISVTWLGKTVHIVGLGMDTGNPALVQGLRQTRGGRELRAREMGAQLARAGIPGAYEGALKYVGNPDLISRSHFARYLVECGACQDVAEVFRRFLVEGKPGFVPHQWATLENAVQWITGAGGMAVLAHPARYGFGMAQEELLFTRFRELGGRGVEVVTGSHTPQEILTYQDMALRHHLLASRGSDFHSPAESRLDLGQLAPLSDKLTPVWQELAGRIVLPQPGH